MANTQTKCRYCTEQYYLLYGQKGGEYVYIDNNYCPMCGRKKDRG